MFLPKMRKLFRIWPMFLSIGVFISLFVIWPRHQRDKNLRDDDYFRVQGDQNSYADHHGIQVVVGHYIGNSLDPLQDPNIAGAVGQCKEVINQTSRASVINPDSTKTNHISLSNVSCIKCQVGKFVSATSCNLINKNMFNPRPYEGKNGNPVMIPPKDFLMMKQLFQINRFNLMASDRIPLNRTLPDMRKKMCISRYSGSKHLPSTSVIIVFHNEAWSTLLRTVHSVIGRSPRHLLHEIILVDDFSDRDFLRAPLDEYVKQLEVPTKVLRSGKRIGLVNARLMGAGKASGKVLTFLDAHCECTVGWLEPLLDSVAEDRTRIVSPVIDIINDDTFSYTRSFELHWGAFNWDLHFRWLTLGGSKLEQRRENIVAPFKTPAMAGGLFSIDTDYFFELGGYDDQMQIWGGENLELSFRAWQCGGSIEIAPCSHVGHLFRKSSPYTFPGGVGETLYSNLARVALVWMDEWAEFYFKFNPEADRVRDKQQIRARLALRERLQCKSFEWYLDNVWPQHFFPKDDRFFGKIIHIVSKDCLMRPPVKGSFAQPFGTAILEPCISPPRLSQMFVMTKDGVIVTDESVCLDAPEHDTRHEKPKVRIMACSGTQRQKWSYDTKKKVLEHPGSKMCLQLAPNKEDGLVIATCNGSADQQWDLEAVPWK